MKKLHLSVMISMFLLSDVAYPVFIIENSKNKEVREDQISNDNSQYPDSCLIRCYEDKASIGTGTFLSQNVVLTIRHVVWLEQKDQAISPKNVKVELGEKSYSVKKILIYPNNIYENLGSSLNKEEDTFALLVLDKAVDCHFNNFKSVKAVDKLSVPTEGLTVMGYGQGGLIKKDDCYNKDIEKIIFPPEHFRYQENVDGLVVNQFPIGRLNSYFAKMGGGDSGSSLLDMDKNIIGITMGGSASFGRLVSKLRELVNETKKYSIFKRNMKPEDYVKYGDEYVENLLNGSEEDLVKGLVVRFNNDIVGFSETQKFASQFDSDFLLFDEKSVEWVNNVVKENSVTDPSCDIIFEETINDFGNLSLKKEKTEENSEEKMDNFNEECDSSEEKGYCAIF